MVTKKLGDGTRIDLGPGSAIHSRRPSGALAIILSGPLPLAMTVDRIEGSFVTRAPQANVCRHGHVGFMAVDTRGARYCLECHRDQARRYKAARARRAG